MLHLLSGKCLKPINSQQRRCMLVQHAPSLLRVKVAIQTKTTILYLNVGTCMCDTHLIISRGSSSCKKKKFNPTDISDVSVTLQKENDFSYYFILEPTSFLSYSLIENIQSGYITSCGISKRVDQCHFEEQSFWVNRKNNVKNNVI